jgi:hypothetical protein
VVRDFLVGLGLSATGLDNWRTNNPAATPRDVGEKFKDWIG